MYLIATVSNTHEKCGIAIFAGMALVGSICFCYHRKTICPEIRDVSERMDFLPN